MLLDDIEYLRLIGNTLQEQVLPETRSRGLQSAIGLAVGAVQQLMQREQALPALVAEFLPRGQQLLAQAEALLGESVEGAQAVVSSYHAYEQQEFQRVISALDAVARHIVTEQSTASGESDPQAHQWLHDAASWEASFYSKFYRIDPPDVGSSVRTENGLTESKLEEILRQRLPELKGLKVTDFEAIPGGFANEIFFFTLKASGEEPRDLVIRKKGATPFWKFWAYKLNLEYAVVEQVSRAGLPVPEPLWLFEDVQGVDGDFYVMARSEGRMVGGLGHYGDEVGEQMLLNLAEFLAKLHAIPISAFEDCLKAFESGVEPTDSASDSVRKNLDFLYSQWSQAAHLPSPGEAFVIDWLRQNVPENSNPTVLVHADCFVHNFLVEGDEISSVVDWESCHFGDPAADMAYVVDQVSELMDWDKFIAHYMRCGGQPIDQMAIDYHKCFLNFRNYFGTNSCVVRVREGFDDIRMTQLGSVHLNTFMNNCMDAIASFESGRSGR